MQIYKKKFMQFLKAWNMGGGVLIQVKLSLKYLKSNKLILDKPFLRE